ncbi:unnamed protein product [Ixodes hexagonus]
MSLVAYGDSDQSDDESSDSDQPLDASTNATAGTNTRADEPDSTTADPSRLFAKLPPPKPSTSTPLDLSLQEIVKQPANATKSKRAQILIPSLNGFDDEEEEEQEKKKFKPAQTGSGLMGLLPAPRHGSVTSKQLMPQVLTRPSVPRDKGPQKSGGPPKPQPPRTTATEEDPWADGPDDSAPTSSFFTFEEPPLAKVDVASAENLSVTSTERYPATADQPEPEQEPDCTVPDYPQQEVTESRRGKIVFAEHSEPGTSAFDVELDDGAVVRLRGRRDEEIHIIDVSADSQVDKSRVLIKGLTEEQSYSPASDTGDFNTSQTHRRKHQITYLAQQASTLFPCRTMGLLQKSREPAKAREQELKNMWAQNRMTKRQTQAKYGF